MAGTDGPVWSSAVITQLCSYRKLLGVPLCRASIVLHGISATPLTRRYREPGEEMVVEEETGRVVTEGGE